jgi:hypothetical protein
MQNPIACESTLPFWTGFLQSTDKNLEDKYTVLKNRYDNEKNNNVKKDIDFLKSEIDELKKISPKQKDVPVPFIKWFLYRMLCAAGAMYSLCAGFDGMISVLSMLFPQLYLGLIVMIGIISALSGLGIFIARDKPSIALELGIDEPTDFSGIEAYLFLLQQYLHLKKLAVEAEALEPAHNGKKLLPANFKQFLEKKVEFENLNDLFQAAIDLNQQRIESWVVFGESQLVLLIAAVLFFSDGFFVGEAIGIFLASLMHLNPVFFTFGAALLLASCALAAYCYVERPSLKEYLHGTFFTNQTELKKIIEVIRADHRAISLLSLSS